jgi:WD40 repeat protein
MKPFFVAVSLIGLTTVIAGTAFGQRPPQQTTLEGHSKAVKSLTFSPDGKMLASASDDGTIKLWEVITGKLRATLPNDIFQGHFMAFSPDGKLLAMPARYETFNLWNVTSAQPKTKFHSEPVTSLAFSKDGALIALGGVYNTLTLLDMKTGAKKASLYGHKEPVRSILFSNDGDVLVSGSWGEYSGVGLDNVNGPMTLDLQQGTIKVWDISTGKAKASIPVQSFERTIAITPDGKLLASGNMYGHYGTIKLLDVATGKEQAALGKQRVATSLAFSPDGAFLASGGVDGVEFGWTNTIKLLDVKSGEDILTIHAHATPVFCVAFSPDGRLLASGDWEGKINLWQLPATKKAG